MSFESYCIYKAITKHDINTPRKTLACINEGNDDVNVRNVAGETFLHLISRCYKGDADAPYLVPVVFQLSNAGIDINAVDSDGSTALHIAAKSPGSQKLIRVLLLIGVDSAVKNGQQKTALELAENIQNNRKVLEYLTRGPLGTVSNNLPDVCTSQSLLNWCKGNQLNTDVSTSKSANNSICKQLENKNSIPDAQRNDNTVSFVHYALAGDRRRMRALFDKPGVDVNTTSFSYIDTNSGNFIAMPLIGEAALLCLTNVVHKLLMKRANLEHMVGNIPLYVYIVQNIGECEEFYEVVDIIMDKIDFNNKSKYTDAVLDGAYAKKLPMRTIRIMAARGLDTFTADVNGYFLRDRILLQNIGHSIKRIQKELQFVDQIVVEIAARGYTGVLQSLVERGYEHIDVRCAGKGSAKQLLANAVGVAEAEAFFHKMALHQKLHRECCRAIPLGDLTKIQACVSAPVAKIRDTYGRTLIHRAVVFGQEQILKRLINVCPEMANTTDQAGRTPLHWACIVVDGEDMENTLIEQGCSMDAKDKNEETPEDFKAKSHEDKQALLQTDRSADYGLDVYLLYRYLGIKKAILAADLAMVQHIRAAMYSDIRIPDIQAKMYQTTPPQKCLLQVAMDVRCDSIAQYLLTQGMAWDVMYRDSEEEISLLEAARRRKMAAVENYIAQQMRQQGRSASVVLEFDSINNFQKSSNQLQGRPDQLQGQPDQIQYQPDQLQGQPDKFQGQLDVLQGQQDQLQGQSNQLQGQPDKLQSQPNQLQGQPDQLQGQLD